MNPQVVHARSAAKINLTLEVGPRRDDGYHEIRSVVHTIGLWDRLCFEWLPDGIRLECNWKWLETEDNLCVRAAQALRDTFAVRGGCRIILEKTIPTGAGLGGGSANAAATLTSLCRLWNIWYENGKLLAISSALGADVPLFLVGGGMMMEGTGERIRPLHGTPNWHVVVVKPPVSISTRWVYDRMDRTTRRARPDHEAMVAAMQSGDPRRCAAALRNEMEDAVLNEVPEVKDAKRALIDAGASAVAMSGSGSAVFALCSDTEESLRVAGRVRGFGEIYVAPFVPRGVEIEPSVPACRNPAEVERK